MEASEPPSLKRPPMIEDEDCFDVDGDAQAHRIPWRSLIPLMMYRITDAATYFLIFPFVTDMMVSFYVPADRIGLYTGLAEGCWMAFEALLAPLWAKIADRYGRRPAMVGGFLLCIVPAVMLGFSTRPWHVMLWRGLFGVIPVGVVGRAMVTEISNSQNRVKVFALYSPSFSMGGMIGTFIGGELAKPYGRLPSWLGGESVFFREYPYALPCMVVFLQCVNVLPSAKFADCQGMMVTLVGYFFLDETKARQEYKRVDEEQATALSSQGGSGLYRKALQVPDYLLVVFIIWTYQFTSLSFDAIYSIYTYTATMEGGLGLHVDTIGLILSVGALVYIISTPFTLPRLTARLGTNKALLYTLLAWPLLAVSLPAGSRLASNARPVMWLLISMQLIGKAFGNLAWALCDMLSQGAFDKYPRLVATGSAINVIAGAGGRATGPVTMSWLFSISSQQGVNTWGRSMYWLVYLLFAIPPIVLAYRLPELKKPQEEGYEAVPLTGTDRAEDEGEFR